MNKLTKCRNLKFNGQVKKITFSKGIDFEKSKIPISFISDDIVMTFENGLTTIKKLGANTFYTIFHQNDIISSIHYFKDTGHSINILTVDNYIYEDNQLVEIQSANNKTIFHYYDNKVIQEVFINYVKSEIKEFYLNDKTQVVRVIEKDLLLNTIISETLYKYNDNGDVQEIKIITEKEKKYCFEYDYDKNKNWIKRYYISDQKHSIEERTISYN